MHRTSWKLGLLTAVAASLGWGSAVTSISPTTVPAGSGDITVTVHGANFEFFPGEGQSTVYVNTTAVATTFVDSGTLTAVVPAAMLVLPTQYTVYVVDFTTTVSNSVTFGVLAPSLASLSVASVPAGSLAFTLSVTGDNFVSGSQVRFAGVALKTAFISINALTAEVPADLLGTAGQVGVQVVNPGGSQTATLPFLVTSMALAISPATSLPSGMVGVAYQGTVSATGGAPPYTFSVADGSLPDGLTLAAGGLVSGTPKTQGRFPFFVAVVDAAGASAAQSFLVTITPAPLNITGGPTGPVLAGTPLNITFTGTGGMPPYRFSLSGSLPAGVLFDNGVLSGTPTAAGAFPVSIALTDSTGAVFSKSFAITVNSPQLSLGGALANGKAGVPYTGQISATGGSAPYTYSGSGLPAGLSLSAAGGVTGTPTAAGQFSLAATVADARGATANATFRFTIAPADLGIVTASLPDGAVGVAYTATLSASGGVPPYTWTVTGLPDGLTATAAGAITGTPAKAGKFTVTVLVKDAAGTSAAPRSGYSVTIAPAPLLIAPTTPPGGTVGTPYTASISASGGVPPYIFSASGLPAGLRISDAGAITGTPTAPGSANVVVSVKDSAGAAASKAFTLTIVLPPAPVLNVNINGVADTAPPLLQPRLQVTLGSSYPVDVVATLTLGFTPDSGADDPTIQFSSGGRTARITVPAGATAGAADVGVQTGSVAGVIAITAQLQAGGQDVTPAPAPRRTIRIAAGAPVIVTGTVTAVRTGTGFTVTLTGYATDRELTQAVFVFTPAAGSNLGTTTLTVPIDALFAPYFSGSAAAPFGSQFTYSQPFTVTGSTQAVASVTVTLTNRIGQSAPATATVN